MIAEINESPRLALQWHRTSVPRISASCQTFAFWRRGDGHAVDLGGPGPSQYSCCRAKRCARRYDVVDQHNAAGNSAASSESGMGLALCGASTDLFPIVDSLQQVSGRTLGYFG
jgi:hypothetical protein